MTDIAHPVTARLHPAGEADLYQELLALAEAGRLAPVLGHAAPERRMSDAGALICSGPGLFVLFETRPGTGDLEFSICRRRDSDLDAEAFTQTAQALGGRLLRFLLAVLDIESVFQAPCRGLTDPDEPVLATAAIAPLPRRVRGGKATLPARPQDNLFGQPYAVPKLTGHGEVPGLPSQTGLRVAMGPPAAPTVRAWHVPVAAVMAVPLVLALLAGSDFAGQSTLHLWGKRGFELSDLTDFHQTSVELVPGIEEASD